jgi:hypothetical protein
LPVGVVEVSVGVKQCGQEVGGLAVLLQAERRGPVREVFLGGRSAPPRAVS